LIATQVAIPAFGGVALRDILIEAPTGYLVVGGNVQ
jgi:hypothetical protein